LITGSMPTERQCEMNARYRGRKHVSPYRAQRKLHDKT
ncbi:hypothetical protein GBF38_011991, partial [Nibea albiflora]